MEARALVAVASKVGGGGGRRGSWAAYAHQCRECPAEAAPYAGTLPSSLAMACGVVAGGSASLPSIPSVSQGPPGQSRRSTSIGRDLGPRAVSQQFLRPRGVGPARAALKLAAQPKNPRCGERHGPQATWRHSSLSSRDVTVEVNSKPQMIEGKRPTFLKAQHSREYSGMDDLPSIIRSHVFFKQSCEHSLYA